MTEKNLKLNDLNRFSKSSRRLVLREYSNCEVPAGCGGVVFRWKAPDKTVAFEMTALISGEFEIFIDGNIPKSAVLMLEKGEHVLSLVISNFQSSQGFLLFMGKSGEIGSFYQESRFHEEDARKRVLSSPDSSWKYILSQPTDESWTDLQFNDSTWKSMISKDIPSLDEQDSRKYRLEHLSDQGAQSLGIEEVTESSIWIRKKFHL